ncbi:MAG TPA: hypothetical protein VGP24_09995 [Glaciihabitans sp.]|jgi:hypothetical protein|nr:hypothetical protein [Glaciihabitans sp.]
MRKINPVEDTHFTYTHPNHQRPSMRPAAVLEAMPPKLRPVSADRVARMSDRVSASGVLEHLAQWRRQDNPRSASARTAVSDRAVLVGLLILSEEDSPLQVTQLAELFEYRIDSEARQLLGLPARTLQSKGSQ